MPTGLVGGSQIHTVQRRFREGQLGTAKYVCEKRALVKRIAVRRVKFPFGGKVFIGTYRL